MVFLTYRHENEEHKKCVLEFAVYLRDAGVNVVVDQLYFCSNRGGPDMGWPKWCAQQVKDADQVLIIASSGWFRCFEGKEVDGVGLGAACEAHLIFQQLYNVGWVTNKFRIVVIETSGSITIPNEIEGYHRYNAQKPDEVDHLLEWLGCPKVTPHPNNQYWLENTPDITWPFADALHVRDAFADLLTRSAKHRVLLVRGGSELGKTSMTQHMLGLGLACSWLACGRLDLKGGTGLDEELSSFAQHLIGAGEMEEVMGNGKVVDRLRRLFVYLQKRATPTLLIVDTYDDSQAREFSDWVEKLLLVATPRADWLRVVVAGQRVPDNRAASWAGQAQFTKLEAPSCEDWITCAKKYRPDVNEEFIQQLHSLANGRASLLWNLLGPKSLNN